MASPLCWLLRLAALCYLIVPLAGQHHGVSKCNITCKTMTRKIPEKLLISYRRNQASCGKPAIILKTEQGKIFCADPEEGWVRKAMENLDRKAAAAVENDGVFEKQIADKPTATPAAGGVDGSVGSKPKATGESRVQETQTALGPSPELPTRLAGSWGTRSPSASKAPDGRPSAGPQRTELFSAATVTRSWQSSAYQPGSDLWTKGEASEASSSQAPSTQTPSTQTPSTQTLPTQAPSTQAPPTQAPFTQTFPTQVSSTQTPLTQAPSPQAPSTQSPTLSYRAPEDSSGSEGPSMQISTQDRTSKGSLGPTDASMGPGSEPHVPTVLTPSEGAHPRKPEASSSGAFMANESFPDPQAATRRQAVGLLAFLGLLFGLGVAMFAYQSLQGCPRNMAGGMVEGLRHVPRSCGSNSYVLVPV